MSITLVVEDNIQLQEFYSLNLYTWVGTDVIASKNANFAQEDIEENSDKIQLIITRNKVSTEKTFDAIKHFLAEKKINIPIICLGTEKASDSKNTFISSGLDIKEIVKTAAGYLGVTAKSMSEQKIEDYFPIPIQHLNNLSLSCCEIYHENKEILFQTDETIDHMVVKADISSGVEYYYVNKNDRLKFVSNYNQVIASKLDMIELNKDEKFQALELSQDLLKERIARAGINEQTIELSQRNLKEMINTTKQTPSLLRFLKRLVKNKSGFHFKHTQVLMFVANHLMDNLDWGTREQKEKLHFIAFFHDIALENDQQALIHSNEELRNSTIPAQKKELVKKHALLAASLVAQYPNAPMGVEQIIKQHHGSLNGVGFSDHFSQNVSPMAIVHILAEDFVSGLLEAGEDFDLQTKITEMREKYTTQRFKKILAVLQDITV